MAAKHPSSASSVVPPPKRKQVTTTTIKKWQLQHEKEHQTLSWLRCDSESKKSLVQSLWCAACIKHEEKTCGVKNFSSAWIVGSSNQKISDVLNHA